MLNYLTSAYMFMIQCVSLVNLDLVAYLVWLRSRFIFNVSSISWLYSSCRQRWRFDVNRVSYLLTADYSPFLGIEKGAVLQEARVFNDPQLDARRCSQVIVFIHLFFAWSLVFYVLQELILVYSVFLSISGYHKAFVSTESG